MFAQQTVSPTKLSLLPLLRANHTVSISSRTEEPQSHVMQNSKYSKKASAQHQPRWNLLGPGWLAYVQKSAYVPSSETWAHTQIYTRVTVMEHPGYAIPFCT